jgi:transposase
MGERMKRFIEYENRKQVTLLPEYLDDFVAEGNPVRTSRHSLKSLNHLTALFPLA